MILIDAVKETSIGYEVYLYEKKVEYIYHFFNKRINNETELSIRAKLQHKLLKESIKKNGGKDEEFKEVVESK